MLKPKIIELPHSLICMAHPLPSFFTTTSEDDIKISLSTIVAYTRETEKLRSIVYDTSSPKSKASKKELSETFASFALGFVRYEHDLPHEGVHDLNRHETALATRVYWEHNRRPLEKDITFEVIDEKDEEVAANSHLAQVRSILDGRYVSMSNHHQGFYMATREQLKLWKERCDFHIPSTRPGTAKQHSEGTQRVWMSSSMLFSHTKSAKCRVKQIIPIDRFTLFTVHHLANKNYKRVGQQGRITGTGADLVRAEEIQQYLKGNMDTTLGASADLDSRAAAAKIGGFKYPRFGAAKLIPIIDEMDWGAKFKGREEWNAEAKKNFDVYKAAVENQRQIGIH
jgi:hypothetical protein